MLSREEFVGLAALLSAPASAPEQKYASLQRVRENIDVVQSPDYVWFLETFLVPLQQLLQITPVSRPDSMDHKIRNLVLEILSKLPAGDAMRLRAADLLDTLHNAMFVEVEENCALCLKIHLELQRAFRPALEPKIQRFFDFVKQLYSSAALTYGSTFPAHIPGGFQTNGHPLPDFRPGIRSFKVLCDVPSQVMMLLNLYQRATAAWCPTLVPLVISFVSLPDKDLVKDIIHNRNQDAKLLADYHDYKQAQCKALSLLVHLLRTPNSGVVKANHDAFASALIHVLDSCPDSVPLRRELLIANKHVLTLTARQPMLSVRIYYPKLAILMNEDSMVGRSTACRLELRSLAINIVAEAVHHVRAEATYLELKIMVHTFARYLHDDTLGSGTQVTCARLLANIVEIAYARRADPNHKDAYRLLLVQLLDVFASKLSSTRKDLPAVYGPLKARRLAEDPRPNLKSKSSSPKARPVQTTPFTERTSAGVQKTPQDSASAKKGSKQPDGKLTSQSGPLFTLHTIEKCELEKKGNDAKTKLLVLIQGMKSVLWSLTTFGTMPSSTLMTDPNSSTLKEEEIRLASRGIASAIPCLKIFSVAVRGNEQDLKCYDAVADMISVVQDPRDVVELLSLQMPAIAQCILEDGRLLRMVVILLGSSCQKHFASVLLQFLMDKQMQTLDNPSTLEASLTIKLFALFMDALKKFPTSLEPIFAPQYAKFIDRLVVLATAAEDKLGYLEMMLSLFRTLTNGAFDQLFIIFGGARDGPALLPRVLNLLLAILDGPNSAPLKNKVIEACLITPARLSEQLAALPSLMKPLVLAMEGKPELVQLALRTLEYWVDSLNPDFLEPAMSSVADRLLASLSSHLKLPPYQFGSRALLLLGKLGGRNRKSKEIGSLDFRDNTEHGIRMVLTFQPSTSFLIPLDVILQLCREAIDKRQQGPQHIHHRKEAFKLIKICAVSLINIQHPTESALPGRSVDKLSAMLFTTEENAGDTEAAATEAPGIKTLLQLNSEQQVLKSLICTLIGCAGDPDIKELAEPFMEGICRHFAFLYAAGAGKTKSKDISKEGKAQRESLKYMDPSIFLEALMQEIAHEDKSRETAALKGMKIFVTTLIEICQAQRRLHTQRLAAAVDGSLKSPRTSSDSPRKSKTMTTPGSVESVDALQAKAQQGGLASNPQTPPRPSLPTGTGMNGTPEKASDIKDTPQGDSPKGSNNKEGAFPPVLDDLMSRIVHSCHGESWGERFGGATAMLLLGGKIPVGQLMTRLGPCTKALMAVLKHLPEHAVGERKQISDSMVYLIRRCLMRGPPLKSSASATTPLYLKNVMKALDGRTSGDPNEPPAKRQKTEDQQDQVMKDAAEGQGEAANDKKQTPVRVTGALRPAQEERCIHNLLVVAATEVFNPRAAEHVRTAADAVLKILSEATGKPLSVLLEGMMEKLIPPLSKRKLIPLKHLPQQTGFAATMTYCLQQKPPLVTLVPEVFQMIKDAHTICEAESVVLLKDMTAMQRQAGIEQLPQLRNQCLQLVCAALSWPEFNASPSEGSSPKADDDSAQPAASPPPEKSRDTPEVERLKYSIIEMLFKQLTSPDKEAVKSAQEGLGLYMMSHKIPKPLLQTSLRPILSNLAHYNKLKLPLLQGLARLLKLLTAWFNISLGEKLIEYLKIWLEPQSLLNTDKGWETGQDIEIAAGILDLFHLLPNPAVTLLESAQVGDAHRPGLVVMTIELEKALSSSPNIMQPSKLWSPYREPLARFLNKHAPESASYFLEPVRMAAPMYFWHLLDIIRSKVGEPLLHELARQDEKLAHHLDPANENSSQSAQLFETQFQALHVLAVMAKRMPTCVTPRLFEILQKRWQHPMRTMRVKQEDSSSRTQTMESKRLAKCMLAYVDQHRSEVDTLLQLLGIFTTTTRVNFDFLKRFLAEHIVSVWSLEEKRAILEHFWRCFADTSNLKHSRQVLTLGARLMVRPILEKTTEHLEQLTTPEVKKVMMQALMADSEGAGSATVDDEMTIEILQILGHLLHKVPIIFEDNPSEVMRFAWSHLRKDESVAKFQTFYTVGRYLEHFPAPEKTGFQVFFALLRSNQNDSKRPLIRQTLDMITPVMAAAAHRSDAERTLWAKYMRKMVVEESQSVNQLLHLWQLAVRHADIFFRIRAWFAPQMINNVMKIGLPHTATVDNRRLAIDMAGLIVYWEKMRIAQPPQPEPAPSQSGLPLQSPAPSASGLPPLAASGLDTDVDMLDAQSDASAPSGSADESKAILPPDYQVHPSLKETLMAFLTRMGILLGDATRDQDYNTMQKRTMEIIEEAFQVWPSVTVKLGYTERMMATNMEKLLTSQIEFPATINTTLEVLEKAIQVQPLLVVQNSSPQINILVDACFKIDNEAIVQKLVTILAKVYQVCPPDSPTGGGTAKRRCPGGVELWERVYRLAALSNLTEAALARQSSLCFQEQGTVMQAIQDRLHQTINDNLHIAGTSGDAITHNTSMPGVCAALKIMQAIEEIIPGLMIDAFLPHLVRLFSRIAAENLTCSGQLLVAKLQNSQLRNLPRDAVIMTSNPAEYGAPVWAVKELLKLMKNALPKMGEHTRGYIQGIMQLVQGTAARLIDPHILLEILDTLKVWIMDSNVAHTKLTSEDLLQLLQSLAQIQHDRSVPPNMRSEVESKLLGTLYNLIASTTSFGPAFGKEVFEKVERPFMLGLRSVNSETRRKFFAIYNKNIPSSLFERLKFILCTQNWENLASTFWLKEALDMITATLVAEEPIKLAPNSALLPCLLARTKGNVYTWRENQDTQAPPSSQQGPAGQAANLSSLPSAGILNQRPMLTNMLSRPQLPYNTNQANYALALGGYSGLASQAYAGLNAQGQPQGFPAGTSQGGDGTGGQSGQTSGAQSQPLNMQMFLRPQMGQQGLLQGQGLQALSVGQQNLNPRGPPQASQMGARPGYLPTQQSVASQLLSQQPIASHAMGRQGGQPVMSQGQFMAGAAQMASRPASLLSTAMGMHLRPQQQMPGQPGSIGMQPGMTSQGLAAGSAGMLAQFPGLQQANQALRPRGPQSYPSAAQGQTPAGAQGTPQAPTSGAAVSQAGVPMSSQGSLAQISAQQASLLGGAKPGQAAPQHMQGQASVRGSMPNGSQAPSQFLATGLYTQQQSGATPGYSPTFGATPQTDSSVRPYSNLQSLSSVIANQQMAGLQRPPQLGHTDGVRPQSAGGVNKSSSQVFNPFNLSSVLGNKPSVAPKEDGLGDRQLHSSLDLLPHIDEMMHEHCRFLADHGKYQVEDLVISLSEIMFMEPRMAYHIWVLIFPIVWATLSETKERQIHLAKPIIQLLSKEFHSAQSHKRPNVIQALMEGISLSQPQPKVPSELIKFVGKKFNAWHISIPLLESHSGLFPQEQRCFDALAELYSNLNEEDMLHGLWKMCAVLPETKYAVAWAQHGLMENSQEVLTAATIKAAAKTSDGEESKLKPTKSEQAYWMDLWVQTSFELAQWENIQEYGKQAENFDLLAQSLAKTQDWTILREDVLTAIKVDEAPSTNIIQSCLLLNDGMVPDSEYQTTMAVNKLLEKQWMLPELSVAPHVPLLSQFQQIIELNESGRLLQDLSARNGPNHQYRDLKDIMETWRLRTPNEWDDFKIWSDVLMWRNQIYSIVVNAFKDMSDTNPQLYQLGYRDKAWNVNKLSSIARKHKSLMTAKTIINALYGYNAMEVQEAFIKIKEQARCSMADPELKVATLNLLNTQNMEYFHANHQAELFRLKAVTLQDLGNAQEADAAFSTALTICPSLPDGWLSWAVFCDEQYVASRDPTLLESAATSYLQAIRHGSVAAREMIPRLLNMLAFDNEGGVVGKAMERGCRQWLPQLINNLQRSEGHYCRRILGDLARLFPQAVYFGLRAHLLATREAAHKAVTERNKLQQQQQQQAAAAAASQVKAESESSGAVNGPGHAQASPRPSTSGDTQASGQTTGPQVKQESGGQNPGSSVRPGAEGSASRSAVRSKKDLHDVVAFEYGREIMDVMNQCHGVLCKQLEILCTELGLKFAPKPEERLMGVVHALLHRIWKLPYSQQAEVPNSVKKELISVCHACFGDNPNRPARLKLQYKDAFLRDLNPDNNPNFPKTMGDLASRLKAWRATMQQNLSSTFNAPTRLEDDSRVLSDFTYGDIEMPGQYLLGDEITPEAVVKLECIGSNVTIIQRQWNVHRRLAFIGSNGKTRHFVVHHVHHQFNTGDERMMQLLRGLNKQLDKEPESRKRNFVYHTPIIVPIWPQVRLIEEEASYASYAEAYEINCARHGKELDAPMIKFKQLSCADSHQMADPGYKKREEAYLEIIKTQVSENIFSQYIYKLLPTCNHLWTFKKTFCTQMALSGLFAYLLSVGGRSPPKLLFAKANAKVFQSEFFCQYDDQFNLMRHDPLPFRLTRNLTSFFTPFAVEGIFISTLSIAAEALVAKHSQVEEDVALFQKDDILIWYARKANKSTTASIVVSPTQLGELTRRNARGAITRLRTIAPPPKLNDQEDPQQGAHMLVEQATMVKNLCRMDPTWQPWF